MSHDPQSKCLEPWKAILNYPNALAPGHVIKTVAYPHTPIALVCITTGSLGPKPSEDWANLLAAAPERLASLRTLLRWHEEIGNNGGNYIEAARAAVAKAEGLHA